MTKFLKSKTINFNAIYLALIAILTQGFGVEMSTEVVAAIQTLMNWILRAITKVPLSEK